LIAVVEALREAEGVPPRPDEATIRDELTTSAVDALGAEAFEAAWAEGRTMNLEEAVEYALHAPIS
jgi:hypothetical protein